MNPINQAQLEKFSESFDLTEYNESDTFELYSIHSVLNGLLGENIEAAKAHLVGQEFGLDGIAILLNGQIIHDSEDLKEKLEHETRPTYSFHFFQAKTSPSFKYGDVAKFFDAVVSFFQDPDLHSTEQLKELANIKDEIFRNTLRQNPSLSLHYCTTGTYNPDENLKRLTEGTHNELKDLHLFSDIKIGFFGAGELQHGYRSSTQKNEVQFNFRNNITLPSHPNVGEAYIGYIDGSELLKLISRDINEQAQLDRRVFYDNVRDYDPNSEINNEIKLGITKGDQKSFIFKNNGVTVVAKSVARTGDAFTIEEFQIVNGCQTSTVLFENAIHIQGLQIPFRLIITNDSDFVSEVIVGTNSQNPVKPEQFWALRDFMKDLEEYFLASQKPHTLFLERRENQYLEESVEKTKIIKPQDLLKALTAIFKLQPQTASRDWRKIKREYEDHFFKDDHNHLAYFCAAYGSYSFDYLIRNKKLDRKFNVFKYYILAQIANSHSINESLIEKSDKPSNKTLTNFLNCVSEESQFLDACVLCARNIENSIQESLGKEYPREKMRDHIRSDSFVTQILK